MIENYPITWLVTELLSVIIFSICMVHALKQQDYKQKLLELCCFVLGAFIFESVGVLITKTYDYDSHRILMAGVLPLSTLLIEACTVYTGMAIFEKMHLPRWTALWCVGGWCMLADFGIDPVYVYDSYEFGGILRGQWNWGYRYDFTFFGIPFFNFSGWLLMCGMYAVLIFYCRKISEKKKTRWFETVYPFISGLILIGPIAICGFMSMCTLNLSETGICIYELAVLIIHCIIMIILSVKGWKTMDPICLKKDWAIPVTIFTLDAYNLIVGFVRGIQQSYITSILVTAIHIFIFLMISKKAKRISKTIMSQKTGIY